MEKGTNYISHLVYRFRLLILLKDQSMRRFKSIICLISAMGLLTGCDLSYTVSEFWICNGAGQPLYIESDIRSDLSSEKRCFVLEEGEEVLLAKSPRYEHIQSSYLPLSHCVYNEEANVRIYHIGDNGEKRLVRTWYYSDRGKPGRELFNENCLSQEVHSFPDGGSFPSFVFVILPEDI